MRWLPSELRSPSIGLSRELHGGQSVITLLSLKPFTSDASAPSPNHGERIVPMIQGIVLHATADEGNEAESISWMRSPKSRVSCHLFVSRDGRVTRLVGDQQRAWHAGAAWWQGTTDVNSITLGIEIANRNDGEPFTRVQYRRVADIVAHYCRQGVSLNDVVSHAQIAPGRKSDPLGWDWDRFRAMVRYRIRMHREPRTFPAPDTRMDDSSTASDEARVIAVSSTTTTSSLQRAPANRASKSVLSSRMIWVNAMTVLASGGMLIADALDLARRLGITLPEEVIKWALFGIGVANIILRLKTTQPLTCGLDGEPCPDAPAERAPAFPVITQRAS